MDDPTFSTYTPISVRDLMVLRIAEPEWLVDGVAVAGSAILLSGREKRSKGWVCIDLACSIVLGEPFLGRAVLEGPCIYLALEESTRTLRDRLRLRLGSRWDVPPYVVPLDGSTGESFSLEDPRSITALINLIEEVQPIAIFLDTLREAHSGREDSSDDMKPLLRPIRQIAHQFDVTLIVTHHQSKMAGTSRGSTAIRAAFDDEIAFTRTDEQQERDIRGALKIEGRNVPKEIICVAFDPDQARWAAVDEPEIVVEPQLRERILMLLDHANEWLTAKEIAERLPGTKLKTIQNKIAEMLQERPVPMAMSGQPKRGSPRRFTSLNLRFEFALEDSRNDAGNVGNVDWSAA